MEKDSKQSTHQTTLTGDKFRTSCPKVPLLDSFSGSLIVLEIIIMITYSYITTYGESTSVNLYSSFQDVHVMVFVGFGFLMTFLRKNGYMSVGMTFMIACLAIQVYPIFTYLWSGLFHDGFYKFEFSIREIVFADFSAAAVLISFGAVVGKVSPLQLIFMTIVEILFYSLNENISEKLGVTDLGGSTLIHTFGAFFGVGVSLALNDRHARGHKDNSAVYHSDMFAMVGTLFLWMFWPSFNSVLGNSDNAVSRAVINTLLSLTGSGIGGFLFSYILRREKKFSMVDVQNANLAGGVAIGSCADLPITPIAAVSIGVFASFVSVFGYTTLQPFLEEKFRFLDTCGILNLHGMPGLIGGFSVMIVSLTMDLKVLKASVDPSIAALMVNRSSFAQFTHQSAFVGITLAMSLVTGSLTGLVMNFMKPAKEAFQDSEYFEVPKVNIPSFFLDQTSNSSMSRADVEALLDERLSKSKQV